MNALFAAAAAILALAAADAGGQWSFPPPPPPEEFGNILIGRTSEQHDVKPASFSHWMHRRRHTCRVCHFELEFNMKAGTTEITEEANRAGRFCGACHDGKELFGHTEGNCGKCHDGDVGHGNGRFSGLWRLPKTRYGNQIDWSAALEEGWIAPVRHLFTLPLPDNVNQRRLELDASWTGVAPPVFPHRKHVEWLDCNDCHPVVFNIRVKSTGVRMDQVLKGEFCGQCHGPVAFPLTDCARCHPRMRSVPSYPEPVSR